MLIWRFSRRWNNFIHKCGAVRDCFRKSSGIINGWYHRTRTGELRRCSIMDNVLLMPSDWVPFRRLRTSGHGFRFISHAHSTHFCWFSKVEPDQTTGWECYCWRGWRICIYENPNRPSHIWRRYMLLYDLNKKLIMAEETIWGGSSRLALCGVLEVGVGGLQFKYDLFMSIATARRVIVASMD